MQEKYHYFRCGDEICRYGVYGLSREYFKADSPIPQEEHRYIELKAPPQKLKVIQMVVTAKCNLKCSYCSFAANAPKLKRAEMSAGEVEEWCEWFNSNIGETGLILITGGEPELYPEAVDYIIKNASGKKIIFTNGALTTAKRLEIYRERNVGVLFSLDGDLSSHDSVRIGADSSYQKVSAAMRLARSMEFDFGISAVVGDHNIERLPDLVEFFYSEYHPASLGLNLPHKNGNNIWNRIEEYTEALINIFSSAKSKDLFIDQINRRLAPLINRQFRFRDCSAQGGKIVVFPGGMTTSCVNECGIKSRNVVWKDRIPLLSDECQDCYAIGICGGGCIFDGESIYSAGRFDKRNCYLTKKLLEYFIWDIRSEMGMEADNQIKTKERYNALLNRGGGTYFSVGHETI